MEIGWEKCSGLLGFHRMDPRRTSIVMSRIILTSPEHEIPPRPKLSIGGNEPYRGYGPFHGFKLNPSKIFRLTWVLQVGPIHAEIIRYEIFACTQLLYSSEISRWKKVVEINLRSKGHRKNGIFLNNKVVLSRRMTGFVSGYRYQITVRGVDIFGREGPFSIPTSVVG